MLLGLCLGDLDIAARTVYGEARGEARSAQVAVARTMVNRWKRTTGAFAKDDTLASACLRASQFSGWTPSDPNFAKQLSASYADSVFLDCLQSVLIALALTEDADPTLGATHYYSTNIGTPVWAIGHTPSAVIGMFRFYNDVA